MNKGRVTLHEFLHVAQSCLALIKLLEWMWDPA